MDQLRYNLHCTVLTTADHPDEPFTSAHVQVWCGSDLVTVVQLTNLVHIEWPECPTISCVEQWAAMAARRAARTIDEHLLDAVRTGDVHTRIDLEETYVAQLAKKPPDLIDLTDPDPRSVIPDEDDSDDCEPAPE